MKFQRTVIRSQRSEQISDVRHLTSDFWIDEIKVLLEIGKDLGYIQDEKYRELFERYDELGKQLYTLHQKWK